MLIYLTSISLPRLGKFVTLHKHKSERRLRWTEADRIDYLGFRDRVEQLYESGPAGLILPRPLLEAVYDESLSAQRALNRILPYHLVCDSESVSGAYMPGQSTGDFEVLRLAGTADEPFGIRHVVIAKGASHLHLKEGVLATAAQTRGEPFSEEELATIDGRSDPALVMAVSNSAEEAAEEGTAKIVAVPAEVDVSLSRNARGEFVREIARVWA